jgi:hypothetical protein
MLWGLLSSTALNMLVVPALYLRFGAAGRQLTADKTGAAGEPAVEARSATASDRIHPSR